MGNEQSTPPRKKSSHTSLHEARPRSASGNIQLAPPRIGDHFIAASAECTPNLERRPSCRNSLGINDAAAMGQTASRRGSRRGSTIGLNGEAGRPQNGSLAESAKLTQYQCTLLVQTWPRVKANNVIFTQAFRQLCTKSQTTRETFQKMSIVDGFKGQSSCDLNAHLRYMTELFDNLFTDLSQPVKEAETRCMEIGALHHNIADKLSGQLWEQLGESMADVITRSDTVRQKREAVKGWINLISFLVDMMKSGYVAEYRRRHARPSIGHADMAMTQGIAPPASIIAHQ